MLLSRGYIGQKTPVAPPVTNKECSISTEVVLAPWDDLRVKNVSLYEIPGLGITEDTQREGCWPTVKRAWAKATGTHHLVLTDDLTLPRGFWEALNRAVSMFPVSPLTLLTVKKSALVALERGHWCISWGCTGAANVLPSHMIGSFIEWQESNIRADCPHDDVRLTAWATAHEIGVLTPIPCLVQHGLFPSVIEDSPRLGVAHSPATVYQDDVTGIDWSQGANDPYFIGISVDRPGKWLVDGRELHQLR